MLRGLQLVALLAVGLPAMALAGEPTARCSREFRTMEREVDADRDWVLQVFAEAGCRLVVQPHAERMLDRLWSLKVGDIDFISAATPLPERSEYAWFSRPYAQERVVMVVHAALAPAIKVNAMTDLIDVPHAVIGPHFGYYGPDWPATKRALQQRHRFDAYQTWANARGKLLRRPNDILVIVDDAARDVIAESPLPLVILPSVLHQGDIVFLFSRKTVAADDVARIDAAIQRLLARGVRPGRVSP